jgi:transposase-like protein
MGEVRILDRASFEGLDLDTRVAVIRDLIPLGLMHVQEELDAEVERLAGAWYARKDEQPGRRYGSNPGSVQVAGQRVPIRVPRIRGSEGEIALESYRRLHAGDGSMNEGLLRRVLYGISCRNYEQAAEAIPGAIGLLSSSVSRSFVEASAAQLKAFNERDLSEDDLVAVFLDGKTFADATMVVALGITLEGDKRILGFVETDTENERVLSSFLRSLVDRGLDISQGILVILDGAKGLHAAVKQVFKKYALVQRCMWHKRENVVSHLAKGQQAEFRRRLQRILDRPTLKEAQTGLRALHGELEQINQSAAASLREGADELLTLHRLGVFALLGRSFKTTNCLENVNSLVEERCSKVDCWKNSSQRQRWMATALLDIEPRLRKVAGHRHLAKLREALQRELKLGTITHKLSKAA